VSTLYLDLGNTKAKWQLADASGALIYDELSVFLQSKAPLVSKVVIASVQSAQRQQQLIRQMKAFLPVTFAQCRVTSAALGVKCAYKEVAKLGVDRWLVVLAAWHRYQQPCVIADLGTAATIDVVDEQGHQGGYIVSGLSLALEGLLKGTQNIRPDPSNFQNAHLNPGANTAEAIYNGALLSLVALIETSYQNLLKTHSQAKLILAGGDAPIVGSHIGCQFELIEDLVFQGMRLLDEAGLVECIS